MDKKKIILIGGGGHSHSVIDVIESAGREILGIIERPECGMSSVLGHPVLGTNEDICRYIDVAEFVIAVGQIMTADVRIGLSEIVHEAGGMFATIVSPLAHVSSHARIGAGTVVMHYANVNAGAGVGNHCIINTRSNIEHDAVVGDYCHISTGATLNGDCRIGDRVFIGSHAVVCQGVAIPSDTIVGAGSVVVKSIDNSGVYYGNPALFRHESR